MRDNSGCTVYSIFSTIDASDTQVDCHRLLLPFGRDGMRVEQMLGSLQLTAVQGRSRVLNHFADADGRASSRAGSKRDSR